MDWFVELERGSSPGDKYAVRDPLEVDCAALLPLCGARCCRFVVGLTAQDLAEGLLRSDPDRPLSLAQQAGACVHLASGRCSVYAHRPTPCRRYDCRRDQRVWLDFDRRIPAPSAGR